MKFKIYYKPTKKQIIWATYQVMRNSHSLTMGKIKIYLKEQLTLFGTDDVSLIGENYPESEALYDEAKEWAERKFKI